MLLAVGGLTLVCLALLVALLRVQRPAPGARPPSSRLCGNGSTISSGSGAGDLAAAAPVAAPVEFVITDLGQERPPVEPGRLDGPAFADVVLKETVVKAASLAHGVRRGLAPATRNRIRFEMRQEVRRARKQRRADLKAAQRDLHARQRAALRVDTGGGLMRRGLWFMAGAGAGMYAVVRARRVAEAFTRDGLSDRWHAVSLGARMLRDEVAQGQAEAETELRERFGLVPHGARATRTRRARGLRARPPRDHPSTGGRQLMDTAEIRRRFVAHFEAAAHAAVPSASLILDDPTLLFVNAGHGAVQALLPRSGDARRTTEP